MERLEDITLVFPPARSPCGQCICHEIRGQSLFTRMGLGFQCTGFSKGGGGRGGGFHYICLFLIPWMLVFSQQTEVSQNC